MPRKTVYLCGASNPEAVRLALRANGATARWDEIVLLDDDESKHGQAILGVEVIGFFALLDRASPGSAECINLVAKTTVGRQKVFERIARTGIPIVGMIDPGVDLDGTRVAPDVIVYGNATVGAGATVESGAVVFMGAVVGHGSHVGPGCIVAPNAVINARVRLGERVYVGTTASILPDLTVGDGATIGANTAVMQSVPPGATVIGVPGRVLGGGKQGAMTAFPSQGDGKLGTAKRIHGAA